MKVSDYIVRFLIEKEIAHVFGYPGGMVTHLMDALDRQKGLIHTHINYHEQACAFSACAYAQITHRPGVAFATSGPGATNLITGICNAYFDSIPTLFITGQVNTNELKDGLPVRQRGFQETDIVSMVAPVTKLAACVRRAADVPHMLQTAYDTALEGRPGPVLLDFPMDVQRTDIDEIPLFADAASADAASADAYGADAASAVWRALQDARRPCLLAGAGVHAAQAEDWLEKAVALWKIPVVSTMPAVDLLTRCGHMDYGFLGAYGQRTANFILAKADLVLSVGARLDVRQTGANRARFAPGARIIRVDIDRGELSYPLRDSETQLCMDARAFLQAMVALPPLPPKAAWLSVCDAIQSALADYDQRLPNRLIQCLSRSAGEGMVITTDVGQNQVWAAQSWERKRGQRILFSAGHGAMGYALPAAIGAYYAAKRPVICITGDGGLQMNIQELAFVARERLPITIVAFNNHSLGMIRHFQEMYFDSRFAMTVDGQGYAAPDFTAVALAYGISAQKARTPEDIEACMRRAQNAPFLMEIELSANTHTFPKLEFGKPNQDQEPPLERALYERLMSL